MRVIEVEDKYVAIEGEEQIVAIVSRFKQVDSAIFIQGLQSLHAEARTMLDEHIKAMEALRKRAADRKGTNKLEKVLESFAPSSNPLDDLDLINAAAVIDGQVPHILRFIADAMAATDAHLSVEDGMEAFNIVQRLQGLLRGQGFTEESIVLLHDEARKQFGGTNG